MFGGSPEFQTRHQGLAGLKSVYGLEFKSFKSLDAGGPLTQTALKKNTVQAADLFTTDPTIAKEKFVVLKDPENLFGFQNVQPLVRKGELSKEGVAALDAVSAKLDTADAARPGRAGTAREEGPAGRGQGMAEVGGPELTLRPRGPGGAHRPGRARSL